MISKQNIRALLLCCSFLWPILSVAEDNSGTNPVNFTYDFRVYSELAQLPNDAGSSALTTAELRVPLGRDIAYLSDDPEESPFYDMGSRWQLRFRAKYKNLSLENPANPPFGASEVSGIGDFDARLLWIASASKNGHRIKRCARKWADRSRSNGLRCLSRHPGTRQSVRARVPVCL
jgi:hypothetical protein